VERNIRRGLRRILGEYRFPTPAPQKGVDAMVSIVSRATRVVRLAAVAAVAASVGMIPGQLGLINLMQTRVNGRLHWVQCNGP